MNWPCAADKCQGAASVVVHFQPLGTAKRLRLQFTLCEKHSIKAQVAAMGAI